jgi:SprT protein
LQTLLDFGEYSEKELYFRKILSPFVAEKGLLYICRYLAQRPVKLKIAKSRKTKYGDFRGYHHKPEHLITVNEDLNEYAFLITLIHEVAHLDCWLKYKNRVKPHGAEWKFFFRELMQPYIKLNMFPAEIMAALDNYLKNPAASSCSDLDLMKALKAVDGREEGIVLLEEIPDGTEFIFNNKRIFRKKGKRRKLILCTDLKNNKDYLINPIAEVKLLNTFQHQ